MPHLSEMAREYKGKVTFIGMDILELIAGKDKNGDYITKVGNFVKNLGDGMDYTVATDTREGVMNETWMKAAGLGGIPTSFVIDQQGKIAWIGHPMGLKDVVEMVLHGQFDEEAKIKMRTASAERNKQTKMLQDQMAEAKKSGDRAKALELADQLIERSIMNKSVAIIAKYDLLREENTTKAVKCGEEVIEKFAGDPLTLQGVSQHIVKTEEKAARKLAVKMMERAISRSAPDDPYAYSNLAEIYFTTGDFKKAVQTQERVVAILSDTSLVTQKDEVINKAKEQLEKYKSGLKG